MIIMIINYVCGHRSTARYEHLMINEFLAVSHFAQEMVFKIDKIILILLSINYCLHCNLLLNL